MINPFLKIKRFFKQLLGYFPTRLPQGSTEYNAWVDDIINTYDLPPVTRDSIVFATAAAIMHLAKKDDSLASAKRTAYKPKYYFVLDLRAAAAKQVAAWEFRGVKERHPTLTPSGPEVPAAVVTPTPAEAPAPQAEASASQ